MRPHPRIRKTIKYGGAALTVVFFAAWTTSVWRTFGMYTPAGGDISVRYGLLFFVGPLLGSRHSEYPDYPCEWYWRPETSSYPLRWTMYQGTTQSPPGPVYDDIGLPIWWFWSSALLITASAWRLDTLARRREREGKCPKCHYDRTGLAAGAVCPECGAAPH